VEDELVPQVRAIERLTNRSHTIRAALKEESATTVVSGALATTMSVSTGQGWVGPVVGIGTGALSWLWKAYRPPSLGGKQAVIASLLRARKQ
jgi:hypothetical protein